MKDIQCSVILHQDSEKRLTPTIQSLLLQTNQNFEIILLIAKKSEDMADQTEKYNTKSVPLQIVETGEATLGEQLNLAFKKAKAPFMLYVNNQETEIQLKRSALDLYLQTMQRHPDAGMVYSDYELEEDGVVRELHLLKHHIGRVRDNQDFGRVFFLRKQAVEKSGNADASLKFNTLYDLRLRISEKSELVHIANRYNGSLYRVVSKGKKHNVFDYLMASKESQLEAERVITEHLKRINAYLAPGAFYKPRPSAPPDAALKASVIIPVNNRPKFIRTAIESVQDQTVKEVEVIVVVNGGPDDPTIEEVKRFMPGGDKYSPDKPDVRLLVFDINNIGFCLNMGAQIARGEYYVQLDSDDRLKPDAVEKILEVYESDPRIGMVIGSYEVWQLEEDGSYFRMEDLPVVTHDEWTEENGRNNLLRINGAGAPRSLPIQVIREIGFSMNEEPFARNYGEDYNMVLQVSERHRIGRVWDAIYEVVRHSGGTDHSIDQATIDRNDEAKDYMRAETILRRQKLNKTK
ncbi:MAG: glycosyltransferase [Calditrichaeota bacterium]|nr:glycosyltransferase [Calditrichota bacterium]